MTTTPVPSITDDQLAEIESLAREATPGPWHLEKPDGNYVAISSKDHGALAISVWAMDGDEDGGDYFKSSTCRASSQLIAAANPATILAMIARIRELEGSK